MRPKISIIIPVFNAAEYLQRCLESILSQDLEDIEILAVDDASTDNSLQVLEVFEKADARVILKKLGLNQGQANARNVGLKSAKGEYILFVDSDDYLEKNIFKSLYECAKSNDLDILEGKHTRVRNSKSEVRPGNFIQTESVLSGGKFLEYTNNISVVVWDKLWKHSFLVSNNNYYENRKFEDVDFAIRGFMQAERVKNIDLLIYNYMIRDNSTMTSKVSPKMINGFLGMLFELQRLLEIADSKEIKEAIQKILNYSFLSAPDYFREQKTQEEKDNRRSFKKIFQRHRFDIIKNKSTNFSLRLLIFINPFLANWFYRKFKSKNVLT